MANIQGFIEDYELVISGVGTTLVSDVIALPHAPPVQGKVWQVQATVTAGPASKVYLEVDTPANSDIVAVYDDPAVAGDPVDAPWNSAEPPVWYNRAGGDLRARVKCDVAGPSEVTLRLKLSGNG